MPFEIMYKMDGKSIDKKKAFESITKIFGENNVSRKEIDMFAYSKDYSPIANRWTLDGKLASLPDFIVWLGKF